LPVFLQAVFSWQAIVVHYANVKVKMGLNGHAALVALVNNDSSENTARRRTSQKMHHDASGPCLLPWRYSSEARVFSKVKSLFSSLELWGKTEGV
jgi:hypothetical protein